MHYSLAGIACVDRIYTDLIVIDVTPRALEVLDAVDVLSLEELQKLFGVPLRRPCAH